MRYLLLAKTEELRDKTVLLRIDCDVDLRDEGGDLVVDEDYRLKCVLSMISFLLSHKVQKIIMIGHIGRPEGKVVEELKLEPIAEWFRGNLSTNTKYQITNTKQIQNSNYQITNNIVLLENVRFDKREEANDDGFAKELAGLGDIYVNEVFGVSHRAHTSIVGIPKYLPSFYGLQFQKEVEKLTWLEQDAPRPLVFVLGGSKSDKLDYLEFLGSWADSVLVGGKLPMLIQNAKLKMQNLNQNVKTGTNDLAPSITVSQYPSIKLAILTPNGLDISQESVEGFKEMIVKAATVVWAGPMGKYEEKGNEVGTYEIAQAVADCPGIKIAGGGDTHRIISRLNLWHKFDFVSVGGGAMLAFLKGGKLVGQD